MFIPAVRSSIVVWSITSIIGAVTVVRSSTIGDNNASNQPRTHSQCASRKTNTLPWNEKKCGKSIWVSIFNRETRNQLHTVDLLAPSNRAWIKPTRCIVRANNTLIGNLWRWSCNCLPKCSNVLESSTRMISFNSSWGDWVITLQTVRIRVDQPSLWNTMITDTCGNFFGYCLYVHLWSNKLFVKN